MHTIRELKQQEKYDKMLKRKNKEKNMYKTQNETLRIKYEGIKKLLEKKDKEIERLNNELKHKTEQYEFLRHGKYVKELEDEIERLNNIINKMEKYLIEYSQDLEFRCYANTFLDKLHELKGSDKE